MPTRWFAVAHGGTSCGLWLSSAINYPLLSQHERCSLSPFARTDPNTRTSCGRRGTDTCRVFVTSSVGICDRAALWARRPSVVGEAGLEGAGRAPCITLLFSVCSYVCVCVCCFTQLKQQQEKFGINQHGKVCWSFESRKFNISQTPKTHSFYSSWPHEQLQFVELNIHLIIVRCSAVFDWQDSGLRGQDMCCKESAVQLFPSASAALWV